MSQKHSFLPFTFDKCKRREGQTYQFFGVVWFENFGTFKKDQKLRRIYVSYDKAYICGDWGEGVFFENPTPRKKETEPSVEKT